MRNKLHIIVLVVFAHNLSYSNSDTLRWNISAGNRFIFPVSKNYTEKYVPKLPHEYVGEMKVNAPNSYFNPFVEINYRKALKKVQRLSFEYTLGFQYIMLENKKEGWFYDTEFFILHEGTLVNKKEEYDSYFTFRALYKVFTYKGVTFFPKLDVNLEQRWINNVTQIYDMTLNRGMLPSWNGSRKYSSADFQPYQLTANLWLHCEYSLSERIKLCAEAGLNLVHANEFNKNYFDRQFNLVLQFNSPFYITDYRSHISNPNYYRVNFSVLLFIHKKHKKS